MSILLNRHYFPSYDELPNFEYFGYFDGDYYTDTDGIAVPSRHWCFMGEIVDGTHFMRHRLDVRDVTGKTINVTFYHDRSEPLDAKPLKIGATIFVQYATQHCFMDGTIGLRIEHTPSVLVLPFPLDVILSAHRAIGSGCCKCSSPASKKCSKCNQIKYCSRECQVDDWKDHKAVCVVLKATSAVTRLVHSTFEYGESLSHGGNIGLSKRAF